MGHVSSRLPVSSLLGLLSECCILLWWSLWIPWVTIRNILFVKLTLLSVKNTPLWVVTLYTWESVPLVFGGQLSVCPPHVLAREEAWSLAESTHRAEFLPLVNPALEFLFHLKKKKVNLFIFILCMQGFACMYVCVSHAWLLLKEARRRHRILWNWSDSWIVCPLWVVEPNSVLCKSSQCSSPLGHPASLPPSSLSKCLIPWWLRALSWDQKQKPSNPVPKSCTDRRSSFCSVLLVDAQ